MPKTNTIIFVNPYLGIGTGTNVWSSSTGMYDISSWFRSCTMELTADDHDDTTFGLTAHSHVQGLYAWSIQSEAFQDFQSTQVGQAPGGTGWGIDGIMFDLLNNKIKFNAVIRPANAARTSDNPEYGGPVRLFTHRPVGGNVGDPLMTGLSLQGAGNFVRYTSSTA